MLQNNEKTAEVLKAEKIVEQAKARLAEAKRKASQQNEAIDCYREIQKHRQREIFFSELSEKEWKQLYMEDEYDLDTCNFRVQGYDIEVKDALIAEALKLLSEKKREVVLMSYYLDMSDTEIARQLNLRQSTIHYHRTSSLKTLKQYLEAKADEEM